MLPAARPLLAMDEGKLGANHSDWDFYEVLFRHFP